MLSRVAETIYWFGRYHERAENTARLVIANTVAMLDLPRGMSPDWGSLIRILGCGAAYAQRHDEVTERRVVNFLVSDEGNPGSILSTLAAARENGRTIREILPREGWEEFNAFYQRMLKSKLSSYRRKGRQAYLRAIVAGLQQHTGLLSGTMNHDTAYRFLNLGRKVERADMTTRILDVKAESALRQDRPDLRLFEDTIWMSVLHSLSAYQMYRQSTHVRIRRSDVLNFLFREETFPRSLAYCVEDISGNLSRLPNNHESTKVLSRLRQSISEARTADMDNETLHDFIDQLQIALNELHGKIASTYFPKVEGEAA